MAEHTPGLWETGTNKKGSFPTCVFGKDFWLQVQPNATAPFIDDDVLIANAHLIAAAPELLETCKKALEDLLFVKDYLPRERNTINQLKEIIAKAEGRTQ